jgi:hypothetical protein
MSTAISSSSVGRDAKFERKYLTRRNHTNDGKTIIAYYVLVRYFLSNLASRPTELDEIARVANKRRAGKWRPCTIGR